MFNPDGTHRADAAIAAEAARAIAQLIKDGVMKPQNAPVPPLKGFDDANKYIEKYPGGDTQPPPQAPVEIVPVRPADCPLRVPAPVCPATDAPAKVGSSGGHAGASG